MLLKYRNSLGTTELTNFMFTEMWQHLVTAQNNLWNTLCISGCRKKYKNYIVFPFLKFLLFSLSSYTWYRLKTGNQWVWGICCCWSNFVHTSAYASSVQHGIYYAGSILQKNTYFLFLSLMIQTYCTSGVF